VRALSSARALTTLVSNQEQENAMPMQRRHLCLAALAAPLLPLAPVMAQTGWSPTRPVRIVAGAAGGILDVAARQLAERLAPALGQAVIVENKPGGGGIVALEAVKQSLPDGHTLGIVSFVEFAINPWLYERLSYDPVKDFEPVSGLYSGQILLAAHPSFPGQTLADLIRLAKAEPGRWFYASSGVGRPPHIWVERFKHTAGIDIAHVPFKGAAPLTQAVLGGEVALAMEGAPALIPHVKSGKLKPLAVTGDRRLQELPDVPTFAEAGVPGIGLTWVALVAPAGTPAAAVQRLHREVAQVLQSADLRAAYEKAGRVVLPATPEQLGAMIRQDRAEWAGIVKAIGLRPE
jgi:tripartite-type tricarboxylate transporter receptor subunit TctC